MSLDTAPRNELIRIIIDQKRQIQISQKENQTLKTRLADALYLISKLSTDLKKLQKGKPLDPPLHVKPNVKKDHPPESTRKQRDTGFARKTDAPTEIVNHVLKRCPDCHRRLLTGWLKRRRQMIDLPPSPAVITEHRTFEFWCSHCRKSVCPKVDLSTKILGNHRVSLRLMSLIANLREQCRLPVGMIQKYFETFHLLHLSQGEIVEILHTVSGLAKPAYEGLTGQIRGSPVVHGDETGWRQNGQNGFLWSFSTPKVKYLVYRKSRGKQVVREVIGDEFEGVLVSDFFGSYNVHLGLHQRCWVHLLRDIKKLAEDYPDHRQLTQWAADVTMLFQTAKDYPGPDQRQYPTPRTQNQQRVRDQIKFRDWLLKLCYPYLVYQTPMTTLCKRIDKYADELFTFMIDPRVPPDNNQAERSLRHNVIARKISGGTRSAKGSQTRFTLASLFGSWRLQSKNPLEECFKLLQTESMKRRPALETVSEV